MNFGEALTHLKQGKRISMWPLFYLELGQLTVGEVSKSEIMSVQIGWDPSDIRADGIYVHKIQQSEIFSNKWRIYEFDGDWIN